MSKPAAAPRHALADPAQAEQAERRLEEIAPVGVLPLAGLDALASPSGMWRATASISAERHVRDGLRVRAGRVRHHDAAAGALRDVHAIQPRAVPGDDLQVGRPRRRRADGTGPPPPRPRPPPRAAGRSSSAVMGRPYGLWMISYPSARSRSSGSGVRVLNDVAVIRTFTGRLLAS